MVGGARFVGDEAARAGGGSPAKSTVVDASAGADAESEAAPAFTVMETAQMAAQQKDRLLRVSAQPVIGGFSEP